jgi:hypothetical protein
VVGFYEMLTVAALAAPARKMIAAVIERRWPVSTGSDPEADAVVVRRRSLDRLRGRGRRAGGLDRGPMRDVAIQGLRELPRCVSRLPVWSPSLSAPGAGSTPCRSRMLAIVPPVTRWCKLASVP